MDQRRPLLHRFQGIEDGRQRFIFHFDKIERLFRYVGVGGGHAGNFLSNVPYFVYRQGRHVLQHSPQ